MRPSRQATPHLFPPRQTRAVSLLYVAQPEEHADRAVRRLETFLDVQRLPGAALFIFSKADAVGEPVAKRPHIGFARHRATLQVLRQQRVGASDRDACVVIGTQRTYPAV